MKRFLQMFMSGLFLFATGAYAQSVPGMLNYQGRVVANGTNFTGTGQFKFALLSGGTNLARQATAFATVAAGMLSSVYVLDLGAGYTSAPPVTVTDATGHGAGAVANVFAGSVQTVTVTNMGTGYSFYPTVTIGPPPDNVVYQTYWSHDGSVAAGNDTPATFVTLPVTKGLYSVLLGDAGIPNMTLSIPPAVFSNQDVRLRVWFNDGVSGFQQLAPDQRIASVGYALMAASVPDGSITSGKLASGAGRLAWQPVTGTTQQATANTGYIATNSAAQVTVTLPTSLNVGDVVRVSGPGAGGWKLAQNAGQSVIFGNATSTPGMTWTAQTGAGTQNWTSVSSSSDGTKLVAVGIGSGYNNPVWVSTNAGSSWTGTNSMVALDAIASSADGSKLVGVGVDQGNYQWCIATSTNAGVNWIPQIHVGTFDTVSSSSDGTKLVAAGIGSGYNNPVWVSTNAGSSWTGTNSMVALDAIASSADGSKLVGVGVDQGNYQWCIATSTNAGVNWIPQIHVGPFTSVASSSDGIKLVVAGAGNHIYTSTDSGIHWSCATNSPSTNWQCVASSMDGSKLVAAVSNGLIYTSSNSGLTWSANNSPSMNWSSVACSADGNKLIAVAKGGYIYTGTQCYVTTVGAGGYLTGGAYSAIELQYIGNGQFMPVSYVGQIVGY